MPHSKSSFCQLLPLKPAIAGCHLPQAVAVLLVFHCRLLAASNGTCQLLLAYSELMHPTPTIMCRSGSKGLEAEAGAATAAAAAIAAVREVITVAAYV